MPIPLFLHRAPAAGGELTASDREPAIAASWRRAI
jgi:hypothetical protein